MSQGHALYDFEGDATQNELSFREGDTVFITDTAVGDGWWQGSVNGGPSGLIPASYIELAPGGGAPPPPPAAPPAGMDADDDDDDWDDSDADELPAYAEGEDDDDDGSSSNSQSQFPARSMPKGSSAASRDMSRSNTIKRSVNRFSAFVKAGAEGFMIGDFKKDIPLPQDEQINIMAETTVMAPIPVKWNRPGDRYGEIKVTQGAKVKKMIKSYMTFRIESNAGVVEKGFRHFQWLHERMSDKYSCVCVPPLPDKTYAQKYGEEYTEKRILKLKNWLDRIVRHPVLVSSKALHLFLTVDEKNKGKWKEGKRTAEKDEIVGPNFFRVINVEIACPKDALRSIDRFNTFQSKMAKGVAKCLEISQNHAKRMAGAISKEYSTVAHGFKQLSDVFGEAGDGDSTRLSVAVQNAYLQTDEMSKLWKGQPLKDQVPWMDGLTEYALMLTQFSDAVDSSKQADAKVKSAQKVAEKQGGEMDADTKLVEQRADVIHMVTLCEISHFHEQRRQDFKQYFLNYLRAQKEFHQQMIARLEAAEKSFTDLPF